MSYFNETLKILLNWEIYSSNDDFKKFVIENNLDEKEQNILIEAYKKLYSYQEVGDLDPSDAPIIDRALELKNRFKIHESTIKEDIYEDTSEYVRITEEKNDANFEKLEFRGTSREYFKIWIVNIFLTLISIGIYSAWAKVRTNRYFYSNTFFQNSSFEYTADPLKILKGRIIIVAIYTLFIISSQILLNPIMTGIIFIFALLISPWMINRAIKFKLKNTKYRNIRFQYSENTPEFYKFYAIHGLLNIITLGLAFPYSLNSFKKLLINNSQYAQRSFSYHGKIGEMYKQFFKIIVGYVVIPFLLIGLFASIAGVKIPSFSNINAELLSLSFIGMNIVIYAGYIFVAYIENYSFSKTSLNQTLFKSTLSSSMLGWIYISNIFLIILSLGLLIPWAKVRTINYKCDNFAIYTPDMDKFVATSYRNEEVESFFNIDIGV